MMFFGTFVGFSILQTLPSNNYAGIGDGRISVPGRNPHHSSARAVAHAGHDRLAQCPH